MKLLTALPQFSTEGSVQILRVRLTKLAKAATLKRSTFSKITRHNLKFEKRKNLPFAECHDVLLDLKGDWGNNDATEEEQRKAFADALNETTGEYLEACIEVAAEFWGCNCQQDTEIRISAQSVVVKM